MSDKDTIVAISTPIGFGAISIVRLSGKLSFEITQKLCRQRTLAPRIATLCDIYDSKNNLLDEAIIIYFQSPKSYTAEDLCEIQCHGGILIARQIVESAFEFGARLALPGEFTKRAFLNNRIDFTQAQAISKLIHSTNQNANKILLSHLKGDLGKYISSTQNDIIELIAYAEVSIDYAEDIEENLISQMKDKIQNIKSKLEKIYNDSKKRQNLIEGHRLAIIGKPNVGKSSILNALLNYDRAIISDIQGTTRDTIEESININGNFIKIIDTAGIRNSQDQIEQIGIEKSKEAFIQSNIILAVFDSGDTLDALDMEIINMLKIAQDKQIIIAINKIDKTPKIQKDALLSISKNIIEISATQDITSLEDMLKSLTLEENFSDELLLTSFSQINHVLDSIHYLHEAMNVLSENSLELFSYNLTFASKSLGEIINPHNHEAVLDKMFENFCLGK